MIEQSDRTAFTLTEVTVRTPGGNPARYSTRNGTSDAALVSGIIGEDEYDLKDLPELTGWAIDIGAHIGTVAVALALDHPKLTVVAVEALPENVETMRRSRKLNNLEGRILIEDGAASAEGETTVDVVYGWSRAENQPDHYMNDNRFIGAMVPGNETSTTITCPALSLGTLLKRYGIKEVELLKIDCEGCEWAFLTSPEVSKCKRIWGEYHEGHSDTEKYAELLRLLEPTHDVEHIRGDNVGIFRATRR